MKGLLTLLMLAGSAAATWYLPAQARHHYSETGVFYTTDYLTLHLPNGVVGFPPGSRLWACFNVHLPDKEVVTDGKYTLAVDPQTLTHDVEYAEELADTDRQTQAATVDGIARYKTRLAASQQAVYLVSAQDIDQVNAAMADASTMGNRHTSLNDPAVWAGSAGAGGGYSGGGGYGGTVVNNVSVTQNNFGGAASRGGSSSASASSPGKIAAPKQPVSGLSVMPMHP